MKQADALNSSLAAAALLRDGRAFGMAGKIGDHIQTHIGEREHSFVDAGPYELQLGVYATR